MSAVHSTWTPVDLSALIDGDVEPEVPVICRRVDDVALLYAGRTHTLAGEPETGKSWLALLATLEQLRAEEPVIYVDFEDDARGVVGRLKAMGATREELSLFSYVRPEEPIAGSESTFHDLVDRHGPSLVVIDGVTGAMVNERLSIISNDDAAQFHGLLPRPVAALGPAVLSLDHVAKNIQTRGRNALGAGHKLAAVSGAAYLMKGLEPFGRGREGRANVVVAKDRPGEVRQRAQYSHDDAVIGVLQVSSARDGVTDVRLLPAGSAHARRSSLESKKEEILQAMGSNTYRTKGDVKRLVMGNSQTVTDALKGLIEEGKVTATSPFRRAHQRPRILSSVPPEGG